jgi:hypothetical protein
LFCLFVCFFFSLPPCKVFGADVAKGVWFQVASLGLLLLLAQGLPEGWLLGSIAREDPVIARMTVIPACLRYSYISYTVATVNIELVL